MSNFWLYVSVSNVIVNFTTVLKCNIAKKKKKQNGVISK